MTPQTPEQRIASIQRRLEIPDDVKFLLSQLQKAEAECERLKSEQTATFITSMKREIDRLKHGWETEVDLTTNMYQEQIASLQAKLSEQTQRADILDSACTKALNERDAAREALDRYGAHEEDCPLANITSGRPCEGGYEHYVSRPGHGQWYKSDKLPPCECGYDSALSPKEGSE